MSTKVSLQAFGTTIRTLKRTSTYFDKVRRSVLKQRRETYVGMYKNHVEDINPKYVDG